MSQAATRGVKEPIFINIGARNDIRIVKEPIRCRLTNTVKKKPLCRLTPRARFCFSVASVPEGLLVAGRNAGCWGAGRSGAGKVGGGSEVRGPAQKLFVKPGTYAWR